MWINFIRKWRNLQFNIDSEQQISEKLFHGRFIYSQSFCQKSTERKSQKKYFSYFIFDDSPGIRIQAFASNKPTHYILCHGDFRWSRTNQTRISSGYMYTRCDQKITVIFKFRELRILYMLTIWIVILLLTDKNVSHVLVCSSIFYYSEKKWIKETNCIKFCIKN